MATARLADRRIREAATQAALRLDVRGPVSRALGQTGIAVPPADAAPEAGSAPAAPASAPARTAAPRAYSAAPRALKPFAETPWPTRKPAPVEPAPLSGLTTDERRVHRILIDTLDVATEQHSGLGGILFADRKKLEALDLAYIDAQLAGAARRTRTTLTLGTVAVVTALVAAIVVTVVGDLLLGVLIAVFAIAGAARLLRSGAGGGATGQRRRILLALRELALLAHADDATSDALAHADALIDRLAGADQAPAPLLDSPARLPDADPPARRTRVRS